MKELKDIRVGFFGTGPLAEEALLTCIVSGLVPKIVITKPDSKIGRSQDLLPPNIVHIAKLYNIEVFQPKSLRTISEEEIQTLEESNFDIFIVASYGNIIPEKILEIPMFGTINIHPSILPKYRGPTPIESALLADEKQLGITIMFLDTEVDHGPILGQKITNDFELYPSMTSEGFEKIAGQKGALFLVDEILLPFIEGGLVAQEQNHALATFTHKLTKEVGKVDIMHQELKEILKVYRACTPWPGCYFIHSHNSKDIRVKISEMSVTDNIITIEKVIPEGKKEMDYTSFKHGYYKK